MRNDMPGSRHVLLIPRDEVEGLLESQQRKDVKIVVPALLSVVRAAALVSEGRDVKREVSLVGDRWVRAGQSAIPVCEAASFVVPALSPGSSAGPFGVSFALPGAPQRLHAHEACWELYYGVERMALTYRLPGTAALIREVLERGGLALFGPRVEHLVEPAGLILVLEFPSIPAEPL
jgi:hypothetical protein